VLYSVSMHSVKLVTELHNDSSKSLTYIEMKKCLVKYLCTFPTSEYTFRNLNILATINNNIIHTINLHYLSTGKCN